MDTKLKEGDFKRLVEFIHTNYGINLEKKRVLIEGRLSRILPSKGFSNYTEYLDNVFADKSGAEIITLVNKLTTNHTFFMREPAHFEYMKEVVLPFIEKNVKDKDARIWCAASSTGEEPYTIAMIIDEYFGLRKKDWDLKILATDISTDVLKKAKDGIYTEELMSSLPADWKKKYFIKIDNDKYRVIDEIRQEVIYRQFNLMDKIVVKKPFDLIFCRNVMIYFDAETKNNLIERFYDVIKDDGYLFIGHAENICKSSNFVYVKPAVYQKKNK